MVGRELVEHIDLGQRQIGAPILKVNGLSRADKVRDVSFEVRSGEIFGISGLIGAGRTELLRLIYGADRADSGTIELGQPLRPVQVDSPVAAVREGIALITEDRKGEGLLLSQSISANIALGNLPAISRAGVWRIAIVHHRLAGDHPCPAGADPHGVWPLPDRHRHQ